ncbi:MAG: hypothetical protein M3O30_00355 [Planctomycetota bacterium]|nr:hypothetical protein [Planctomycetota bacterium]
MSNDPRQKPDNPKRALPYVPERAAWPGRPSTITAIGIFGVIIASLGLVINLGAVLVSSNIYAISGRTAAPPVRVAYVAAQASSVPAGEYFGSRGFSANQRAIVIQGFAQFRPLSEIRRVLLDSLLADAGKNVIGHSLPEDVTPDRIAAMITDVAQMPATNESPADLFTLATGRLQLTDKIAVFFSSSSPEEFRTDGNSFSDATGTYPAAPQMSAVIRRISSLCGNAINPNQLSALQSILRASDPPLITAGHSIAEAVGQVQSAQALSDGSIAITTSNGSITIGLNGNWDRSDPQSLNSAGQSRSASRAVRPVAAAYFVITLFNLALSAYLLTIAILLFCNARHVWGLHMIYCVARILLAGAACFLIFRLYSEMNAGSGAFSNAGLAMALIFGAAGAIYPAILLATLLLPPVREYFATPSIQRLY